MNTDPKLIIALDDLNQADMTRLIEQLDPTDCALKVGKGMFTAYGPDWVKALVQQKFKVFLDLKFHDIPQTVATACRAAAQLGVWMVDVHISGGSKMLAAAVASLAEFPQASRPLLVGITVLTSMDAEQLRAVGVEKNLTEQVLSLARLAEHSGLDGVVCSAQEAALIRAEPELSRATGFRLVTPGIRLESATGDDQVRVMTPREAICAGANHLVIGRPITQAVDPMATLKVIQGQLN